MGKRYIHKVGGRAYLVEAKPNQANRWAEDITVYDITEEAPRFKGKATTNDIQEALEEIIKGGR